MIYRICTHKVISKDLLYIKVDTTNENVLPAIIAQKSVSVIEFFCFCKLTVNAITPQCQGQQILLPPPAYFFSKEILRYHDAPTTKKKFSGSEFLDFCLLEF